MKAFRNSKSFFIIVGIIVVVEAFLFLYYGGGVNSIRSYFNARTRPTSGIILFEEKNCSPCDKVDNFITSNKIENKITFTRMDISDNNVRNILADKSQICGLNPSQVGTPFLWDGKRCILGYVDVIRFFQQETSK
jgi:hypothetical protein